MTPAAEEDDASSAPPPDKLSINHRRTHVPHLLCLPSHPNMTTATIKGLSRLSLTSSLRTRSLRTAFEGGGGGGGGGGDRPRGRQRRCRENDDNVHNDNRIVIRRCPCIVRRAGRRWHHRPSFPCPRPSDLVARRRRPWRQSRGLLRRNRARRQPKTPPVAVAIAVATGNPTMCPPPRGREFRGAFARAAQWTTTMPHGSQL
jgi:hypothetical protein